jgi:hypothetical protein
MNENGGGAVTTVYKIVRRTESGLYSWTITGGPFQVRYEPDVAAYPPRAGYPLFAFDTEKAGLRAHTMLANVDGDRELWRAEAQVLGPLSLIPGSMAMEGLGYPDWYGPDYDERIRPWYVGRQQAQPRLCLALPGGGEVALSAAPNGTVACARLRLLEQVA